MLKSCIQGVIDESTTVNCFNVVFAYQPQAFTDQIKTRCGRFQFDLLDRVGFVDDTSDSVEDWIYQVVEME